MLPEVGPDIAVYGRRQCENFGARWFFRAVLRRLARTTIEEWKLRFHPAKRLGKVVAELTTDGKTKLSGDQNLVELIENRLGVMNDLGARELFLKYLSDS
jgi:hypothetical protein